MQGFDQECIALQISLWKVVSVKSLKAVDIKDIYLLAHGAKVEMGIIGGFFSIYKSVAGLL
jgi:hypothetical protein